MKKKDLPKNGLIIGKFIIFHTGHCFLIETALQLCKVLHVCVCSKKDDFIDGKQRCKWIQETYQHYVLSGKLVIHHITKEIQEASIDNPHAPEIWAQEISRIIDKHFNVVFASEEYGWHFAKHLNAKFYPIDIHRDTVPVSSQKIQKKLHLYWNYLPPAVRKTFVTIVGIRGEHKRITAFVKTFKATIYIPYRMREKIAEFSKHEADAIAMAEFSVLRAMSTPFIFIVLPYKNYKNFLEFHSCKHVFTLNSQEKYLHACTVMQDMVTQKHRMR